MSIRRQSRYFCPVDVTLSVINGKWKPLILFHLKKNPQRFSKLQAALPHVSHKVLTQHLRELEAADLICRAPSRDAAAVTYQLTDFGLTLRPSLTALAAWGQKYHRQIGVDLQWPGGRL